MQKNTDNPCIGIKNTAELCAVIQGHLHMLLSASEANVEQIHIHSHTHRNSQSHTLDLHSCIHNVHNTYYGTRLSAVEK